jgi:predicted O-linked N-acetylglucosamine transferase (SPINDLY family)
MNEMPGWDAKLEVLLAKSDYSAIAEYYEQAISEDSEKSTNYWYLGLAYLLCQEENAAQSAWLFGLSQFEEVTATLELTRILNQEAQYQLKLGHQRNSWLICQYLDEINPQDLENIFWLIQLSIDLDEFQIEYFAEQDFVAKIQNTDPCDLEFELIKSTLQKLAEYPSTEVYQFIRACVPLCADRAAELAYILIPIVTRLGYQQGSVDYAISVTELCLEIDENSLICFEHLPRLYQKAGRYTDAIAAAERFMHGADSGLLKFVAHSILLNMLMGAGLWQRVPAMIPVQKQMLQEILQSKPGDIPLLIVQCAFSYATLLAYAQDDLAENRWFHNSLGQLLHGYMQANTSVSFPLFLSPQRTESRLKIGYVASTLRGHSVGWLSRWLFQYHNRQNFDISVYLFDQSAADPFFQHWIAPNIDWVGEFGHDYTALAEKLSDNRVQILVDLDSLTLDNTYMAVSMKPAPVQVSWLGWDAPGLPAIDYFIADPYVLPENAQQYYQETIWRLPQTYLAVQGFEVDIPTLRKEDLKIPSDAITYLTAQVGYKRNPDNIRLQIRILKEVAQSHLLIKGVAAETFIQDLFMQIAQEEGVSSDRLHFLPQVPNEYIHRANLRIADVVLDTYPYNGATTTLETIWMGVPIVTRAGSTFPSRNSYAFLHNAGVSEGIAWSDEEYIHWGIRFGREENLRQKAALKMKQSQRTSPLWNAKQFALDMENAYQQMWQRYSETHA